MSEPLAAGLLSAGTLCVILAGGRSSRMGVAKWAVCLKDGRTMLDHVADALRPLGCPMAVASPPDGLGNAAVLPPDLTLIRDAESFEGPLAALEHLMRQTRADVLLLAGCDQPLLRTDDLRRLLAAATEARRPAFFMSEQGERLDPLPGAYHRDQWASMGAALATGVRSPRQWLAEVDCEWVVIDEAGTRAAASFNTREQLVAAGLLPPDISKAHSPP
ncbi:hypothetical protein CVU37_12900 [candidate division BRC1 bacterium HGW-BRC1-1]|jgi:molybdopterin-guanine dinucleotide biosynthesis protein A|nr:MAG: hypothetical protein CVU37_12900 [candidate division BRC1 bacterium HGW-BRC1-1]